MSTRPSYPFSRAYYRRARLGSNLVVGFTTIGILLYDWDSYLGTNEHVFSGIRPAVRASLDWLWGVGPSASLRAAHEPLPLPPAAGSAAASSRH